MRQVLSNFFIIFCIPITLFAYHSKELTTTDVLIIGGGASGTMAAIQAARMGVSVIIVEETPWLGGMLTAAGVSAVDGNYNLRSGLWEEFRQALNGYYGGEENLKTGWVSNVLFEPNIGAEILSNMVESEKNITVFFECNWKNVIKTNTGWSVTVVDKHKNKRRIKTKIRLRDT